MNTPLFSLFVRHTKHALDKFSCKLLFSSFEKKSASPSYWAQLIPYTFVNGSPPLKMEINYIYVAEIKKCPFIEKEKSTRIIESSQYLK